MFVSNNSFEFSWIIILVSSRVPFSWRKFSSVLPYNADAWLVVHLQCLLRHRQYHLQRFILQHCQFIEAQKTVFFSCWIFYRSACTALNIMYGKNDHQEPVAPESWETINSTFQGLKRFSYFLYTVWTDNVFVGVFKSFGAFFVNLFVLHIISFWESCQPSVTQISIDSTCGTPIVVELWCSDCARKANIHISEIDCFCLKCPVNDKGPTSLS